MSNQLDYEINKELGECYLFMGDFDKAEECFKKSEQSRCEQIVGGDAFSKNNS